MQNSNFVAVVVGSVFLGMFGLICFGISGYIIAALNQFADINLFYYYNGIPIGMLALTGILILILLYYISRDSIKEIKCKHLENGRRKKKKLSLED